VLQQREIDLIADFSSQRSSLKRPMDRAKCIGALGAPGGRHLQKNSQNKTIQRKTTGNSILKL
jgi:hypothetical protein